MDALTVPALAACAVRFRTVPTGASTIHSFNARSPVMVLLGKNACSELLAA